MRACKLAKNAGASWMRRHVVPLRREILRPSLARGPDSPDPAPRAADPPPHEQQQQQQPQQAPPPPEPSAAPETLTTRAATLAAEVVASPLFYLVAGLLAIKLVSSTGEDGATIFVFAALPITALTALSKSSVGKQVQQQLEARLPELQAQADSQRRAHQQARQRSKWYGPGRVRLPGPLGSAPHLTGADAGDAGFDPLGLASDPAAYDRYREAELLHARWAMLGVVGCLVPEALALQGVQLGEPVWWKVGASKLNSDLTLNWGGIEGFRIAGKQGIGIIAACQAVLMGGPEYARYVGIRSLEPVGVFLPGDKNYPGGGPFDPLNYAADADGFVDQAVREVKNGRLAMLAMLGFFAQAAVTRKGPLRNLMDFAADPAGDNLVANMARLMQG
ncbi:hypothetical protein PLESTB_001076000 [Pleodorina starrii]|uniref:Chlorophyll a-b binding protein, chloroplastic n=1 Tax=Pleodorina starrii TaxID=330485 RepID=A0A9W6BQL0_9CHLO|nr:hypothetical protein PLESTM_001183100 [Pleodorina starrii]GLC56170.1 hypothetical protein PLESTB_001076000 [Pleodorina starrii]GLC74945.1 hypothetical protein PLESTF_001575800 [Pleodorina starrii]